MEEETVDMYKTSHKLLEWASSGMNWSDCPMKSELMEKAKRLLQSPTEIARFAELFDIEGTEMYQYTQSTVTWTIQTERPIWEFEWDRD